mgnify:CR=1 FL=1
MSLRFLMSRRSALQGSFLEPFCRKLLQDRAAQIDVGVGRQHEPARGATDADVLGDELLKLQPGIEACAS